MTFIHNTAKDIVAKQAMWSRIYGRSCIGTISLYVMPDNEGSTEHDLMLICGSGVGEISASRTRFYCRKD